MRSDAAPSDPVRFAEEKARAAQEAGRTLALLSRAEKDAALGALREELLRSQEAILAANAEDMEAGQRAGRGAELGSKLDRLLLNPARLAEMCRAIGEVAALEDPVGQVLERRTRPNGLDIRRVRCPFGVVGIIYEARPNVTVDAATLCLKSGNAVVLKGGSDALATSRALVAAMRRGVERTRVPPAAIQLLDSADRAVTGAFLRMRGLIDVIVPRGGAELIRFAQQQATVPVIETGASVVHAYVDAEVDAGQAVALIVNSKCRRVSICNALDTLLVHRAALEAVGEPLARALAAHDPPVEVRADGRALPVFARHLPAGRVRPVEPERDYDTEYLDYILAVKVVDSLDEALGHIRRHSLKHTEAIFTADGAAAARFLAEVDAACVMHNASTQFTDGNQFGLGAEIGISTQKLHVRGPFALEGLTTTKWLVAGSGQLRP
ncbi:MAG: glutamate-5-semialdehyde dehydrogenase [Candidatus Lambdaproteobacteria bacterium]|nr:glutamate-5-semialdehyde dehydrogenase [Candidatus Lambdaproteobacteria bacterium]